MDGLLKALHRQFRGELTVDPRQLRLYAADASLFQIEPQAVAYPADEADVSALIQAAGNFGVPLVARGNGTGQAGAALGAGIAVDFRRHFNAVLELGDNFARVQPGVTLRELADLLAGRGRRIDGLGDPSPAGTAGGWIAAGSGGALAGCRFALDGGEVISPSSADIPEDSRWSSVRGDLRKLAAEHSELLKAVPPDRFAPVRRALLGDGYLPLLAGSEGTLGLFTELTLRTTPLPGGRAAALFAFDSLEAACATIPTAALGRLADCTLYDRRALSFIRRHSPAWERLLSDDCEAALLAAWEGDTEAEARKAALDCIDLADNRNPHPLWVLQALDESSRQRWDDLRREAFRGANAAVRGPRPLNILNGTTVGIDALPAFIDSARKILAEIECTATLEIRGTTGRIDLRPILDLERDDERAKLWPLADRLYAAVLSLGGRLGSGAGIGLARTPWIEREAGPYYLVLQGIKRAFDHRGLFNPGKIVGLDPGRPAWPLRPHSPKSEAPIPIALPLAADCHGCGDCKTADRAERTCPPHRALRTEGSAPRGMMAGLQYLASLPDEAKLDGPVLREIAAACVQCQQCHTGCPAGIDVPRLMLETRIAAVRENGLTRAEWFASRAERWLRWGGRMPGLSNRFLAAAPARRVLQWLTGLARDVRFGPAAFGPRRTLTGSASQTPDGPAAVLLWVGSVATYGGATAEATLQVLHYNRIPVRVPLRPIPSLAAPLFLGDIDRARRLLRPHLGVLAETVRNGGTILALEPSDATVLRRHLDLLFPEEPERDRISAGVFELTDYLNRLHGTGRLQAADKPIAGEWAYHMPCHRKRGIAPQPPLWLDGPLSSTNALDAGCSGMAGAFGLQHANRRISRAMAEPLRLALNLPGERVSLSECSACRLQMRQLNGRAALHPVEILARSYDLPGRSL